ncbi:hypothetical protein SAMN05216548_101545 [Faunimonas pinastri]|uniref:Uncharacterized protein n=1 Tax=Faunimonas pinastri TaxID=1855383 RepID=A0A1H9AW33_9HYPH|nr:hypothetical protein [Faunimonas pinastri]SEP81022.1 hypothetical protein SAMN05216548_101545 [Faunimonas pinastri]
MQGKKTHEQFIQSVERKDDVPKPNEPDTALNEEATAGHPPHHPDARESEFAVSEHGMHQETRGQNKHNNPGQTGHKPQKHHSPEEEKEG